MKKARVLSTICISAMAGTMSLMPVAARAQLPEGACYLSRLDAAALAAQPRRGVQALAVEFRPLTDWERQNKGYWRHVRIAARMAGQGQARRDGAMGATLTADAECRTRTLTCWGETETHFALRVLPGGQLELRTTDFPVADFGGSMTASNLAEAPGRDTVYVLDRAEMTECEAVQP